MNTKAVLLGKMSGFAIDLSRDFSKVMKNNKEG